MRSSTFCGSSTTLSCSNKRRVGKSSDYGEGSCARSYRVLPSLKLLLGSAVGDATVSWPDAAKLRCFAAPELLAIPKGSRTPGSQRLGDSPNLGSPRASRWRYERPADSRATSRARLCFRACARTVEQKARPYDFVVPLPVPPARLRPLPLAPPPALSRASPPLFSPKIPASLQIRKLLLFLKWPC